MSNVFTVFNHGTCYSRSKDQKEVVTNLHNCVAGYEAKIREKTPEEIEEYKKSEIFKAAEKNAENENKSYEVSKWGLVEEITNQHPSHLITEGPGSSEVGKSSGIFWGTDFDENHHAQPGQYNPIFGTHEDKQRQSSDITSEKVFAQKLPKKDTQILFDEITGEATEVKITSKFQDSFYGNTDENPGMSYGVLFGTGWEDNVYKVVWMLTHLIFERGQEIDVVNLVGWSRGAVTCIKIAHKINEVFPQLDVNIMAFDPVPGGFSNIRDHDKSCWQLPRNVRNFVGLIARYEYRGTFFSVDSEDLQIVPKANGDNRPDPVVTYLTMPGNHTSIVTEVTLKYYRKDENLENYVIKEKGILRNSYYEETEVLDTHKLAYHIGAKFLQKFGTVFKNEVNDLILSDEDCLEIYNYLQENDDKIRDIFDQGFSYGSFARLASAGMKYARPCKSNEIYAPDGYVNLHHYALAAADDENNIQDMSSKHKLNNLWTAYKALNFLS